MKFVLCGGSSGPNGMWTGTAVFLKAFGTGSIAFIVFAVMTVCDAYGSEPGGFEPGSLGTVSTFLQTTVAPAGDSCVEIEIQLDTEPYANGCKALQIEIEEVLTLGGMPVAADVEFDSNGPFAAFDSNAIAENTVYICDVDEGQSLVRFVVSCMSPNDGLMRSIRSFSRILVVEKGGWPELLTIPESEWSDPLTSSPFEEMPVYQTGPTDFSGMELAFQSLTSSATNGSMAMDSDPLLVFVGNWKYVERRLQCEPPGGSTGARFPCSEQNNLRAIKGAQVEIWRYRNGILTKLFTGWTSPTLLSGGYLFGVYADYQPGDLFWSVLTLKRSEPGGAEGDFYWGVAENNSFGWAPSLLVGGVDYGGYIMADFGSTTVNYDLVNIYASIAEAWDLWSDSSVYEDFLSWSPLFINHYEEEYVWECPNGAGVSAHPIIQICSYDGYESWRMPFLHVHEFGHDINQSAFFPQLLQAYYNYPYQTTGGSHTWSTVEWEETAFIEGWANFVASSVMYEPGASAPLYLVGSAGEFSMSDPPGRYGPDCEYCSGQPNRCEANVARFFWDLFDTINDDYYGDYFSLEPVELVDALAEFPDCTTNRCAGEANGSLIADDGPNIFDLDFWLTQLGYNGGYIDGIIDSNCLEDSATD